MKHSTKNNNNEIELNLMSEANSDCTMYLKYE